MQCVCFLVVLSGGILPSPRILAILSLSVARIKQPTADFGDLSRIPHTLLTHVCDKWQGAPVGSQESTNRENPTLTLYLRTWFKSSAGLKKGIAQYECTVLHTM